MLDNLRKGGNQLGTENSGQPKYKVIFEALRQGIASGEYKEGARLPSEGELSRRFAVSRMTVVKAMRELQQQGLVVRRVGSGTYAAPQQDKRNGLFGLLIPELGETEIFEPICQGMAQFSHIRQHSLHLGQSQLWREEGTGCRGALPSVHQARGLWRLLRSA